MSGRKCLVAKTFQKDTRLEASTFLDARGGNLVAKITAGGQNCRSPERRRPDALAELLRPVFPELRRVLPIEAGLFVAFEWIGLRNYLGESLSGQGQRTRGKYFTSADAAVLFEAAGG
jgi:hypothetical protein